MEASAIEPGKQNAAVPQYWTGVKERNELGYKQVRSYDIEMDVTMLMDEDDYKSVHQDASKPYLFDTDSFKLKDPTLVPQNHALGVD